MPPLQYELANQDDDPALRKLLRENPMPGTISLSFEREPDYFRAAEIDGSIHQTIVARDVATQEIVGLGSRSVRSMFVNGAVQSIGYISQLRVKEAYRSGMHVARALAAGFRFLQELHQDGSAPYYLMSIVADNAPAHRLLTSGLPDYPWAIPLTKIYTHAVSPRKKPNKTALPFRILEAEASHAEQIVTFLNRSNSRFQYSPAWTTGSLFMGNLTPSDFFLVLEGDELRACMAVWDQSEFKQTIVRGYGPPISRWRTVLNAVSPLGGWPHLPDPGSSLQYVYACHVAVANDDHELFCALLAAVQDVVLTRCKDYFVIGFSETHPLRAALRKFRSQVYQSQLYLVGWGDMPSGSDVALAPGAPAVGLEIAIL